METPADPPVTVSGTCERALPPPERSKQEAGPQYHILVFSNSKLWSACTGAAAKAIMANGCLSSWSA